MHFASLEMEGKYFLDLSSQMIQEAINQLMV